ncbi:acyl carrier protein [Streptomyces sp. GKU 257-1]|nr:acyl carrier protein [Streptomyces sp. GKU 257-1]
MFRLDPDEFDPHTSLVSLGLDSLLALQLRNRIGRDTALEFPATAMWTPPHGRGPHRTPAESAHGHAERGGRTGHPSCPARQRRRRAELTGRGSTWTRTRKRW